jgi:ketosteroid isomerase-like protein
MLIAFSLTISFFCQQQENQEAYENEAKQKIAELDKLFFEAWENEDLESLMTCLDDDFINMPGFGEPYTKAQCRKGFQDLFDTYSVEDLTVENVELTVDRNYAFETGRLKQKWITKDKQDTVYYDSRILTVFKKLEDGDWKWFRHMIQQRIENAEP